MNVVMCGYDDLDGYLGWDGCLKKCVMATSMIPSFVWIGLGQFLA